MYTTKTSSIITDRRGQFKAGISCNNAKLLQLLLIAFVSFLIRTGAGKPKSWDQVFWRSAFSCSSAAWHCAWSGGRFPRKIGIEPTSTQPQESAMSTDPIAEQVFHFSKSNYYSTKVKIWTNLTFLFLNNSGSRFCKSSSFYIALGISKAANEIEILLYYFSSNLL